MKNINLVFVLDGVHEIEEYDQAKGQLTTAYLYGSADADEPLMMVKYPGPSAAQYYYHADVQSSTNVITDENGNVVERYVYETPYGLTEVTDATDRARALYQEIGNPFRFQGRRFDDESGLYYFRNRYYDPEQGRFVSRDPIGIWGDPGALGNGYAFCGGNPLNRSDPFGLWIHNKNGTYTAESGDSYSSLNYALGGTGVPYSGKPLPPGLTVSVSDDGVYRPVERRITVYLRDPNLVEDPGREAYFQLRQNIMSDMASCPAGQVVERQKLLRQLANDELKYGASYAIKQYNADLSAQKFAYSVATAFTTAGLMNSPGIWMQGVSRAGPSPDTYWICDGKLTDDERREIQSIANKYDTTIDVVGSRANGEGRNIETNFPVGKDIPGGPPTRSDIDFRIDTTHPQADEIIEELKQVGNGAGSAGRKWSTTDRATVPPFIRFAPQKP